MVKYISAMKDGMYGTEIIQFPHMKLRKSTGSLSIGTSSEYGTESTISVRTGYDYMIPMAVKLTVGGTFATDETVTVRITVYFDDGSSAYLDKSYTATGSETVSVDELAPLYADGKNITSVGLKAASNQSSTSVTVDYEYYGIEF